MTTAQPPRILETPETQGDRELLVASLGIPSDAAAPHRYIEDGGAISSAGLAALVDAEVAERTWMRWNPTPDDRWRSEGFRAAFEALLSAGAGMGYSLERFRTSCQELQLPRPDAGDYASRGPIELRGDPTFWVETFERAVTARNAVDLTVFVRREVRDAIAATNLVRGEGDERWDTMTSLMAEGLFYELGIAPPRLELATDDALGPTEFRIEINDARLPRSLLPPPELALVNDTASRLAQLAVRGQNAVNPANRVECAFIAASDARTCTMAGLTIWSAWGYVVLTVSAVARRMAGAFLTGHLVDHHCDLLAQAFPRLVEEVRNRMSRDALSAVLRALLDEEISIRNLLRIFDVLVLPETHAITDIARYILFSPVAVTRTLSYGDAQHRVSILERRLSRVRAALKREISHKHTRGSKTLTAYLLDPDLERRLSSPLPLTTGEHTALLKALEVELDVLPPSAQLPVILTNDTIRLRLRREIGAQFPLVAVLSFQESEPDLAIQPLARIDAARWTDDDDDDEDDDDDDDDDDEDEDD